MNAAPVARLPSADCATCGGARLSGTGHKAWCSGHILFMPEWRRRSLEAAGNSPFVAVADMTDRVAGR